MTSSKHPRRLRFGLRTLLIWISVVAVGIAVYSQWGRGPIAEYRAKQWVLSVGGTITYTYHGDTRHVRVTIPSKPSGRYFDASEVLCIRAIPGLTELSFGGQEFVFSGERDDKVKSGQIQVGWERFEGIVNGIEQLTG